MKLYVFEGQETDWVAANSEDEARQTLIQHYGISQADIDGSYESISEADPAELVFDTDDVDEETEDAITTTAAALIEGKTRPFVVSSTYQ